MAIFASVFAQSAEWLLRFVFSIDVWLLAFFFSRCKRVIYESRNKEVNKATVTALNIIKYGILPYKKKVCAN